MNEYGINTQRFCVVENPSEAEQSSRDLSITSIYLYDVILDVYRCHRDGSQGPSADWWSRKGSFY